MNRKSATQMKIRGFDLDVKEVGADGSFAGYASVFGVIDSYREIVAPKAFRDSLKSIRQRGRPLPALWQHRAHQPIGTYQKLEEDDTGLRVEGTLLVNDVVQAREAHALLKAGAVSGLSIGYYVRDDSWDDKERVRTLKKLDLVEVSLVTFPANDAARIDEIKAKLAHGSLPSLSEFEHFLREAGFSKTESAVIANRGLAHLLRRESEGENGDLTEALSPLKSALDGFTFPKLD